MSAQEEVYNLTKKSNFRPTLLEDMDILLISYITIVHHYVIFFFENKETIKPTIMNCEICNKPMTIEDYEYCDICGDCLE